MELGQLKSEAIDIMNELDQYKTAHNKLTAGLKEAVAESIKYKRELDELSKKLDKECNMSLNIEGQLHDAIKEKTELKREVEKLNKLIEIRNKALKGAGVIIENQKSTIKALRLQADEYFDLWQEAIK